MLLEAMYHVPRDKWAYAYDTETIHLRVRTKRDDVDYVVALTGDKYDWQHTSYDIIMEKAASDDKFDYWEAAVRPKYKRLSYTFRVSKGMETVYLLDNGIRSECPPPPNHFYEFPYIHGIDLFRVPPWAKDAVFYQIMTERFANGNPLINPEGTQPWGGKPELNNFFGGDLQGVLDHLDDLQELGVNALLLHAAIRLPFQP